ncbi:PP2C family serine/threonine-protein phosphatase [Reyranella sp.]|uniref:PP2C family serine/threonine-protein phosphatase n=1 Tax=Reyranella sp. TaxID=1929291 RepID=UPI0025EDD555|nr:PP2C family serine/threonine-protein phosphatase [Reyranella sp.]
MPSAGWKSCAVSVPGFDHVEAGIPCQDANRVRHVDADRFVAVGADGAGSAKYSDLGSTLLCEELSWWLADRLSSEGDLAIADMDEALLRHWVEEGIDLVRAKVIDEACENGGDLSDYHATVVGVLVDKTGGAFFHIGDGAGLAAQAADLASFVLSPPENGEYANETYFFTQDDWRSRLRFLRFGPECDLIALMSDGVTPFALAKGGQAPFAPFLEPVSKFLDQNEHSVAEAGLLELLQRDGLRKISGDDKTLVWVKRTYCD